MPLPRAPFFLLFCLAGLQAEPAPTGTIFGTAVDGANRPAEYIAIAAKRVLDGKVVRSAASDVQGHFALEALPWGDYALVYGPLGGEMQTTATFSLDERHPALDTGRLTVRAPGTVTLDRVEVSARREAFYNSIDRKIYAVGADLRSTSGSASDLFQNIPSVQVDIEGNVSLRGNSNVLILVNGKPSVLMSAANRADMLAQMPADAIERIEVITNPSAKYKPDGTAGIINIVEKRKRDAGLSGAIRVNLGNDRRANAGLTASYSPGKYNVFATVNVRQDDRPRFGQELRRHLDGATNRTIATEQDSVERMRPLTRLAQIGGDYSLDADNKIGATASYNYRTFFRTATVSNLTRADNSTVTSDYDRRRTDPEWQKTTEVTATYQHSFPEEGRELSLELKRDRHWEQEDNRYANVYRTPAIPVTQEATLIKPTETGAELTADYVQPQPNDGKLEVGYAGETNKNDMDFRGATFDSAADAWIEDRTRTNRFVYRDRIHAVYLTYGRLIGSFGALAGIRLEEATVDSNQVTLHLSDRTRYVRVHPTLHLSYNLTDTSQLQLNYSHRIHRPESDDLNPFPEYQDPFNLHAGNPKLRPEETHSIEAGYQYRKERTTYLAAAFFRDTYHAFTPVTRYIDAVTLFTTHENLASSRSGGLEFVATTPLGRSLSINASANAYYSAIDAANLGYAANRSAIAWDGKLNAEWRATKTDLIQLNANYSARRLTAQGSRRPTYVANLGWRHEFKDKKTAFVLTISDLFNSLKERSTIDTPTLHDEIVRRRSARIVFAGLAYSFGKPAKKKDETLQFDNGL